VTERREVRVAESLFDELDLQLGSERGPNGEPSATDFLVVDLPTVVEAFAHLRMRSSFTGSRHRPGSSNSSGSNSSSDEFGEGVDPKPQVRVRVAAHEAHSETRWNLAGLASARPADSACWGARHAPHPFRGLRQ